MNIEQERIDAKKRMDEIKTFIDFPFERVSIPRGMLAGFIMMAVENKDNLTPKEAARAVVETITAFQSLSK